MVLFSTTLLSGYCRGITALPAAVAAAVVVAAGVAVALPGKRITRRRVLALGCLVCLSLSRSPFLSLCLFGEARSFRPYRHPEPVRLLFWLLARFVDGVATSAGVVRRPHGSPMRSSTMSCVYSTHHSPLALNSFPSFLQRILLCVVSTLLEVSSHELHEVVPAIGARQATS